MAKLIKAYSCDFKCGRTVLTSKKAMEGHEAKCFHNPKRRACITCAHFESYLDSNGMEDDPAFLQTWRHTECNAEIDISEKLRHDCDLWQPAE